MFRRLVAILVMAMVGVVYDAGIAAADEPVPPPTTPEDELADARQFIYDNGSFGDGALLGGSGSSASSAGSVAANIQVNPWGCRIKADHPHEPHDDPGSGNIRGKAAITCSSLPPTGHVTTILQELSRWDGDEGTIEAVNYSVCPSGQGDPDCYGNKLKDRVLMRGYVVTSCEVGKTYIWVHIAEATLTVEGVTYSGLHGVGKRVECEG